MQFDLFSSKDYERLIKEPRSLQAWKNNNWCVWILLSVLFKKWGCSHLFFVRIEPKQMLKTTQPFTEYRAESMSFALLLALWHCRFTIKLAMNEFRWLCLIVAKRYAWKRSVGNVSCSHLYWCYCHQVGDGGSLRPLQQQIWDYWRGPEARRWVSSGGIPVDGTYKFRAACVDKIL